MSTSGIAPASTQAKRRSASRLGPIGSALTMRNSLAAERRRARWRAGTARRAPSRRQTRVRRPDPGRATLDPARVPAGDAAARTTCVRLRRRPRAARRLRKVPRIRATRPADLRRARCVPCLRCSACTLPMRVLRWLSVAPTRLRLTSHQLPTTERNRRRDEHGQGDEREPLADRQAPHYSGSSLSE